MHTSTYIHMCTYTHMQAHIHTYMNTHIPSDTHVYMCTHKYMLTCLHAHFHVCMRVCLCVHACSCVHTRVHTSTHAHRPNTSTPAHAHIPTRTYRHTRTQYIHTHVYIQVHVDTQTHTAVGQTDPLPSVGSRGQLSLNTAECSTLSLTTVHYTKTNSWQSLGFLSWFAGNFLLSAVGKTLELERQKEPEADVTSVSCCRCPEWVDGKDWASEAREPCPFTRGTACQCRRPHFSAASLPELGLCPQPPDPPFSGRQSLRRTKTFMTSFISDASWANSLG